MALFGFKTWVGQQVSNAETAIEARIRAALTPSRVNDTAATRRIPFGRESHEHVVAVTNVAGGHASSRATTLSTVLAMLRVPAWIGAFYALLTTNADPDLWGHLRFGLDALSSGHLRTTIRIPIPLTSRG